MCDRNPRDNLKPVKKNGSQDRTPSQSLCFAAPALPNFAAALQLLCGMRLVASLARVLSPDSSHGNKSHTMGNTRICLKCNWALSNARYAPEALKKKKVLKHEKHPPSLVTHQFVHTYFHSGSHCWSRSLYRMKWWKGKGKQSVQVTRPSRRCVVLLDFAWIHSPESS